MSCTKRWSPETEGAHELGFNAVFIDLIVGHVGAVP